jgi:hypothetical protein
LLLFAGFLAVCLVKLYANVEQLDPLPNQAFPGGSLCLFLNHGLNLLPFPLLVLYLARQFPEEVSIRASAVFLLLAVLVSLWELLPFVVLAFGWESLYSEILGAPWRFILNFCVVLATLYIFERLYQAFIRKRPLSGALFLGGIVLGLIVLLPIPLSYFAAVKHVYFLGWGLFFFQGLMVFEVVRLQVRTNEAEVKGLKDALERRETLGKFIAPDWARRLSRDSVETLRPGDNRSAEAVLVQFRSPDSPELWLPLLGAAVSTRKAVLVDRSAGTFSWALESWSETALAFALEAQQKLLTAASLRFKILLTKATVKYHILNLDSLWFPMVSDFPFDRLEELYDKAERYGATLVLDGALRDGLAIGGWRRHRSISVAGTEIELYEGETEPLAQLKDKTLDSFESALGSAREENWPEAIRGLFAVVRENPFDQAARTLLSEWGQSRRL